MTTRSGRDRIELDEAHLWLVDPERVAEPELIADYQALLAPEERERQCRYVFARHRHEFLVTRALVRATLSRYTGVPPQAWRFRTNRYGRPEIEAPLPALPLRFNLSNTAGLIACLVVLKHEVGVDVENLERSSGDVEIADRFFSPSEVAALHARPADGQRLRFFEYWTLKEAYIKARGLGLAQPLGQFSFELDDRPIRIRFDPELPDDPAAWQFALWRPSPRHLLAAAIRRGPEPDLRIRLLPTVPLSG